MACEITIAGGPMSNNLARYRQQALVRQYGRCCYCKLPVVPQRNLNGFASAHGLTEARAKALQCTAEHLQARCDGGGDKANNMAAACITCNQRRHRMTPAPTPDRYRQIVQRQMEHGMWHKRALLNAICLINKQGSPQGAARPGYGVQPHVAKRNQGTSKPS